MKPLLLLIGGALFMLTSCYKSETVYYDELDVTQTNYEVDFNYSSYTSFSLPDSTILKTNFMTDQEIENFYAPGGAGVKTRELLRTSFESRGYTYTDSDENSDFVAVPTILMMKVTETVYYPPGWWWGYPGYGWGYPGYGWGGYPGYGWGYPGGGYSYQYKVGTIVLEMVDGESFRASLEWQESNPGQGQDGANEVPELIIRWLANIDGYLSDNQEYNEGRAKRGMDEAFEQSPYLKK